jgi:hypothetical protein
MYQAAHDGSIPTDAFCNFSETRSASHPPGAWQPAALRCTHYGFRYAAIAIGLVQQRIIDRVTGITMHSVWEPSQINTKVGHDRAESSNRCWGRRLTTRAHLLPGGCAPRRALRQRVTNTPIPSSVILTSARMRNVQLASVCPTSCSSEIREGHQWPRGALGTPNDRQLLARCSRRPACSPSSDNLEGDARLPKSLSETLTSR